jgi:hypothetical protein
MDQYNSIDTENALDKSQHPFMLKNDEQIRNKGTYWLGTMVPTCNLSYLGGRGRGIMSSRSA